MDRGQPDRVPVWCPLSLEHIIRNGTPDGEIPKTIEDFISAECRLTKQYEFDGVVLYLPGIRKGTLIERQLREWIHSVPGGTPDRSFEEIDPESWDLELPRYELEDFYSSRLARELLGPDYHIGGWCADGFSRAIQWFPRIEDALVAIRLDPARFKSLVRYFDHHAIASAENQVRLGGLESIQISSPYAGSSFLSPDDYRNFVLPSVSALAKAIESLSAYSYLHTCGFLSDRLELAAGSGVDGLECLDPPPLGNVELAEAKQRIGAEVFLKGNLDSVNTLLRGAIGRWIGRSSNAWPSACPEGAIS